jgi:hypothetical protein
MASIMKILLGCMVGWVATAALAQTNFAVLANLDQTNGGYLGVGTNQSVAVSFTTGYLTSTNIAVSILLDSASTSSGGTFEISLCSDVAGVPGNSLAALSGNSQPFGGGVYSYTNTSPVNLLANTHYWVVAASPNTPMTSSYSWDFTLSTNSDAGSIWTLGSSEAVDNGEKWRVQSLELQFSVATGAPTTDLAIFQPIILTFTNGGFPFVLQQSTNVNSTNWAPAASAIQLSTINSNFSVFIVPPAGQKMFYRASAP